MVGVSVEGGGGSPPAFLKNQWEDDTTGRR